nr:class II cytokine receptor 5 [Danio rerio]
MEECALLLLLLLGAAASTGLSPPQNLGLQTLNTQYVLHWDWPGNQSAVNQSVRFTAQYMSEFRSRRAEHMQKWLTVCEDVEEQRCDFTHAGLFYLGIYLLRVRANTREQASNWTQISFCPDKHAALGPPSSVTLRSVRGVLEMVMADPLSSTNESMKTLVQDMYYLIQYWRQADDTRQAKELRTPNNLVVLPDLARWSVYCVRVQSRYDFENKSSVFSDTHCAQTEGQTAVWLILLYFLLALVLVFLLVLLLFLCSYRTFQTFKSVCRPSAQLPAHIQELWLSDADTPQILLSKECVCEHMDVALVCAVDTHIPEEPQDSGGSSSDTHSSGDSGVYSEEDSATHTHSHSLSLKNTHTHDHTLLLTDTL